MIGILGGTFDPIHYGHLRPAQEVMQALGFVETRVIPAARPPHRAPPVASAEQRLAMARLACAEFPGFVVDARECERPGLSYTVDTLVSLRAEFGAQPLCLLLGTDAFHGLESWHSWQRLPELAHLVVMQRPGSHLSAPPAWARPRWSREVHELRQAPAGRILFQPVTPHDISGTRLRAALANDEALEPWLPRPVAEYIRTNRLYINQGQNRKI